MSCPQCGRALAGAADAVCPSCGFHVQLEAGVDSPTLPSVLAVAPSLVPALGAAPALAASVAAAVDAQPDGDPSCPACGRSLVGVMAATCPSCGVPVSTPRTTTAPQPAAASGEPVAAALSATVAAVEASVAAASVAPEEPEPLPVEPAPELVAQTPPPDPMQPPVQAPVQSPAPPPPANPAYPAYPGMYPPGYAPPPYGQPAPPSYPLYGQPAPGGVPAYPQPGAPSMPLYGQPVPPGYPQGYPGYPPYPGYGQPGAPSVPLYGQPVPGGMPGYGQYGQAAPPSQSRLPLLTPLPEVRRRPVWLIVLVVVLIVALVGVSVAAVVALSSNRNKAYSGGPSAGPTPTATPNVVFFDPLTSPKVGWANDSHCSFASDGYHVNNYVCFAPAGEFSDASISVKVHQINGDIHYFYGLAFRWTSSGNYYLFEIDSNGKWEFRKVVNHQASNIVPYVANAAILPGLNETNTLSVRAQGSHFTFFVNGTQVGQADDATYTSGNCGVAGAAQGELVFTDFSIALVS